MLGVSAGRITLMLDSGILQGYRRGRGTYVTVESIERRAATIPAWEGSGHTRPNPFAPFSQAIARESGA